MIRRISKNPLIEAIAGKKSSDIPANIRRALICFAATVVLPAIILALLISWLIAAEAAVDVTESYPTWVLALGIVTYSSAGMFLVLAVAGSLFPILLSIPLITLMRSRLKQYDWDTLIKLTPVTQAQQVVALVYSVVFPFRIILAIFGALPVAAGLIRILLASETIMEPPSPITMTVHLLAYAIALGGIYITVFLFAACCAFAFDDAIVSTILVLGTSVLMTIGVQVGTFAFPLPVAIFWMLIPYLIAYGAYRLAVRLL